MVTVLTPKLMLTYFNFATHGEPLQLAVVIGKVKWIGKL
jgi:hypothetical protein